MSRSSVLLYDMMSYWNSFMGEKLTAFADDITVSNNFLRQKFGGTVICHARDTCSLDPDKFDNSTLRKAYCINDKARLVMFLGTPRTYKGIEDLIEAMVQVRDRGVYLAIVGFGDDPYCQDLKQRGQQLLEERFIPFGLQPIEKVPEFLAMADIVVIPQRNSISTLGQMPAKIFDAMAMAKPIIATRVADIPEVVGDCGRLIEPSRPDKLAEAIQDLFENYKEASAMGIKARQKCIAEYSWDAATQVLSQIFARYEQKTAHR